MIQGIFYARFFPQEGTKIVAQSPPGCIVPTTHPAGPTSSTTTSSSSSATTPAAAARAPKPCLFDFDVLQEYIIPRNSFFNRYMAVHAPGSKYAVLGFPVAIANPKYQRNEFIFNFGLVVESDVDQIPYERVVRRLAVTFAEMEKQNEYLSRDGGEGLAVAVGGGGGGDELMGGESEGEGGGGGDEGELGGRRPIASLLEIIKEDLNNYGECMIPVDDANTINMKLFPHHCAPPEVKGWHVPVAKMKFADVVDPTWDLTLQKVIAHIDGVSDVRRIAFAADVSLALTKLALQHLLYYDTVLLLDMFFFSSCYAPRPAIHDFVANVSANDGYYYTNDNSTAGAQQHGVPAAPAAASSAEEDVAGGGGGGVGSSSGGDGSGHHLPPLRGSLLDGPSLPTGGGGLAGGGGNSNSSSGGGGAAATAAAGGGIVDECANYVCIMSSGQRVSNYQLVKLMTTFCVGRTIGEWLRLHMDAGFDVLRYVDVRRLVQFGVIKGLLYRVHKYVVSKQYLASLVTGQSRPLGSGGGGKEGQQKKQQQQGDPLQRYMDGMHNFDQIITEQNLTDGEIMEKLRSFPAPTHDLTVLYR